MSAGRQNEKMELSLAPPARLDAGARDRHAADDRDADLLRRIAAGDARAFDTLYRAYVRAIYSLALRRLGDRETAEEAVQETFAAVWRSARSYRPERGAASAWMYAIARNAVVDRFRARPDPVADPPDEPSQEAGPAERAEHSWLAWRVHRAVEVLPEREREVLELAYWQGLSQREIAERLEIPLGTVKTRTRSGLARLAELLDEEGVW